MADDIRPNSLRPFSTEWYQLQAQNLGDAACRSLGFYAIPDDMRLSVVIPVYNEEKTLRVLVDRVRSVPVRKEMILIDDCSRDRSREVMQALEAEAANDDFNRIRTFYHEQNQGKGAALKTGFANVDGDIVIIQDADLE
ncbi:MAG: glycosyltransferase family 2 protein, partial [Planctomycetaceae bacterium]|nr:glycosyltransferase family 2 protein [Planctomycetaceae bacterium]